MIWMDCRNNLALSCGNTQVSSKTMRPFISIIFFFLTFSAVGQNYPFVKDFVPATITFNDSTQKAGFIKWNTNQNERLRFKPADKEKVTTYSPSEILGFQVDTLKYKSLFNIELCAENYPLLGRTSTLKQSFGQILHEGKINIYFVVYHGYEPVSGAGIFPNIVFEKFTGDKDEYAAYPILIRMKDKKYEKAKEILYSFFADYPKIVDKIKQYKPQQDFFEIINLLKQTL